MGAWQELIFSSVQDKQTDLWITRPPIWLPDTVKARKTPVELRGFEPLTPCLQSCWECSSLRRRGLAGL